jgi:hypothetical protein
MGTCVRVLSLVALLGLTGCHVYADASRGLARAANPAVREAEARTAAFRHQQPQECLCPGHTPHSSP